MSERQTGDAGNRAGVSTRRKLHPAARVAIAVVVAIVVFALFRLAHASLLAGIVGAIAAGAIASQLRLVGSLLGELFGRAGALVRRRTGRPFWFALPSILVGLVGLLTVAYMLLDPDYTPLRYSTLTVVLVVGAILLLIPTWFLSYRWIAARASTRPKRVRRILLGVYFTLSFVLQVTIGYATLRPPGFDSATVFATAINIADHTRISNYAENSYYRIYPTNIFATFGLGKYFAVLRAAGLATTSEQFLFAAVVLNAVLLSIAAFLAYLVVRRIGGTRAAVITLVFSTVFLTISPWIGTPYTDIFSIVFPILAIYLYLLTRSETIRWRRYLLWIAVGLTIGVGYTIKPTVLFALLAIVLVELARLLVERADRTRVLSTIVVLAVAGISFVAANQASIDASNHGGVVRWDVRANTRELPFTHYLAMGAQGTGAYSHADAHASGAIVSPSARLRQGIDLYVSRVEAMGPSGYAAFLGRKAAWTMDDGTFFQWGEGGTNSPFIRSTTFARSVQNYYSKTGSAHQGLVNVWQAFWIIILALLAVPLFVRRTRLFSDEQTVLRTAFLILFVFLMLFETRARYLYLYLPVLIAIASLSLDTVARKVGPTARRLVARRSDLQPEPTI